MADKGMDPTVSTEKRNGEVWKEESLLREVINAISEKLERLECRLQPILRPPTPPPPNPAGGEAKLLESVPDLVARLRTRTSTARSVKDSLVSLLERLEI